MTDVKKLAVQVYPPVEFIRDEMEARGWTPDHLLATTGLSQRKTDALLNGCLAITPLIATKLARVFGTSATFWYRLQRSYDAYSQGR